MDWGTGELGEDAGFDDAAVGLDGADDGFAAGDESGWDGAEEEAAEVPSVTSDVDPGAGAGSVLGELGSLSVTGTVEDAVGVDIAEVLPI